MFQNFIRKNVFTWVFFVIEEVRSKIYTNNYRLRFLVKQHAYGFARLHVFHCYEMICFSCPLNRYTYTYLFDM